MKKVAAEYHKSIAHIKARTLNPAIKFYSSILVAQKTGDFDAQYWVDNLVSPVRFGNVLELLCHTEHVGIEPAPFALFTEVGPHGALAGPVRLSKASTRLASNSTTFPPWYGPVMLSSAFWKQQASCSSLDIQYLCSSTGRTRWNKPAALVDDLANSRKLLKPRRRLVLSALPAEDGRDDIALSSEGDWHARLQRHGFQVVTPDHDSPTARFHMIVATAIDAQSTSQEDFPPVRIICQSQSDDEFASLADSITIQMTSQGYSVYGYHQGGNGEYC